MEQAKELLIKHLKALPIGYNETEMLQCLNDKKSEEGMILNAMLNAVTEALNIHSVIGSIILCAAGAGCLWNIHFVCAVELD